MRDLVSVSAKLLGLYFVGSRRMTHVCVLHKERTEEWGRYIHSTSLNCARPSAVTRCGLKKPADVLRGEMASTQTSCFKETNTESRMKSAQCFKGSEGSEERDTLQAGGVVEGLKTWRGIRVLGLEWLCDLKGRDGGGTNMDVGGVCGERWIIPFGRSAGDMKGTCWSHGQTLNHVSQGMVPVGDSQDDLWWYMMDVLKLGVCMHVH